MFWRWNSGYAFMDCEVGQHVSQTEMLSQRLFGATFWGDYAGDIYTRGLYEMIRENWPTMVDSIDAAHGQGLILSGEPVTREFMEVLAWTDPVNGGIRDYPMYDEGWHSDWECELKLIEQQTGWWGQYNSREVRTELDNLGEGWGELLCPDSEWSEKLWEFADSTQAWDNGEEYWEGADNLIVTWFEPEDMAMWLVQSYAAEFEGQKEVLF